MKIRNVSIDEFLTWPDDRPSDGDMIRDLIAGGRSREDWLFVGYIDDQPVLRIGYRTAPMMSNPAHAGALATTRVFAFGREGTDQPSLYRSFIAQTLPTELPADVHLLETRLNESKHANAATRAAELVAVGFGELMEKVGYLRTGGAVTGPRPGMSFRTVEDIGREAYTDLIAVAGSGGSDRESVHYQAHTDIRHWAEEQLRYLGDRDHWLLVGYVDEDPVGILALDDPNGIGYISYVGVAPNQRGNGYANDLVQLGVAMATRAGWTEIRADTDVQNLAMRAAFEKAGFREEPGSRIWGHILEI